MATYWTILTVDRTELASLSDFGVYRYYLADNIRYRNVPVLVAFCRACSKFVLSEHIHSAKEIDGQIEYWKSQLKNGADQSSHFESSDFDLFEALEDMRQLFLNRKSLPRCLECGSTLISQESVDPIGKPIGQLVQPEIHPEALLIELEGCFEEPVTEINRFYTLEGIEVTSQSQN